MPIKKNRFFTGNQNHFIFPMIYGKKRIDGTEYAEWLLQQQTLQSLLKVFCDGRVNSLAVRRFIPCPDLFMSTKVLIHKANCWKHEEEWRWIYYEKENENIKFPFIIQKHTAVYLGRNMSEINETKFKHQFKEYFGIEYDENLVMDNISILSNPQNKDFDKICKKLFGFNALKQARSSMTSSNVAAGIGDITIMLATGLYPACTI